FPLNNDAAKKFSPDRQVFLTAEEALLKKYMDPQNLKKLPATLDDYMNRLVFPTLEAQKKAGAIAVKFEAAYLRSLKFDPAGPNDATRIYADAQRGPISASDYKKLQDFLFRAIAGQAGRLGMAVHVHTGPGCGDWFDTSGSD